MRTLRTTLRPRVPVVRPSELAPDEPMPEIEIPPIKIENPALWDDPAADRRHLIQLVRSWHLDWAMTGRRVDPSQRLLTLGRGGVSMIRLRMAQPFTGAEFWFDTVDLMFDDRLAGRSDIEGCRKDPDDGLGLTIFRIAQARPAAELPAIQDLLRNTARLLCRAEVWRKGDQAALATLRLTSDTVIDPA